MTDKTKKVAIVTGASRGIGATVAVFTGRSKVLSALRQLAIATVAAGVTYGIGNAIGTHVGL